MLQRLLSPLCPYFGRALCPVPQVPGNVMDMNVLLACQLLLKQAFSEGNSPLLHQLYQYLLFDFNIWAKSHFTICLGEEGKLVITRHRSLEMSFLVCLRVHACPCACVSVCGWERERLMESTLRHKN